MMRQVFVIFLALVFTSLALAGDQPRALTLFFTGMVEGNFGPCGCKNEPNGGLARRAGYSKQYHQDKGDVVLQVDLGNFFEAPGPKAQRVNQAMLTGIRRLPLRVMNLAPGDLFLWDELATMNLSTEIISTNLVPRKNSLPRPARYAIVNIPASGMSLPKNLRIGFLGISDPSQIKPSTGFRGLDPEQTVAEVLSEIQDKIDFAVVLADFEVGEGRFSEDSILGRIAQAHDSVYAVLTTEKRYLRRTPIQVNNAVLASSIERGRHLGRLTFRFDEKGRVTAVEPDWIDLKESLPHDPELLEIEQRLGR